MGAVVREQADLADGVAKGDEILAQQAHAPRWAISRKLAGEQDWHPVLAEEVAHGGSRADPTEDLVIFGGQHVPLPRSRSYPSTATRTLMMEG